MHRGAWPDVVVAELAPVLELLAGKDQPLLVRRDTLPLLFFWFGVWENQGAGEER